MDSDYLATDDAVGRKVLLDSRLGSDLRAWQPLAGGISATVCRLDYIATDGCECSCVVRVHGDVDYGRNPALAADEYAVVSALHAAGVSVPRPVFLGASMEPFGRPYAIYEFVPGELLRSRKQLTNAVPQLATWLAELHSIELADLQLQVSNGNALLPRQALREPKKPADAEVLEPQIRGLLSSLPAAASAWRSGPAVLLHGDYWSGNVIWRDGRIAAVIDWEDFGVGDALADLACARLELLWAAGETQVERFTRDYCRARKLSTHELLPALAYWDLCAVLPFAHTLADIAESPAQLEALRRRLAGFVARAFAVFEASPGTGG